jgi:hypothetical protein
MSAVVLLLKPSPSLLEDARIAANIAEPPVWAKEKGPRHVWGRARQVGLPGRKPKQKSTLAAKSRGALSDGLFDHPLTRKKPSRLADLCSISDEI